MNCRVLSAYCICLPFCCFYLTPIDFREILVGRRGQDCWPRPVIRLHPADSLHEDTVRRGRCRLRQGRQFGQGGGDGVEGFKQTPEFRHRLSGLNAALGDVEFVRPIGLPLILVVAPVNAEGADEHEVTNGQVDDKETRPPFQVRPRCSPPAPRRLRPCRTDEAVMDDALEINLVGFAQLADSEPTVLRDKLENGTLGVEQRQRKHPRQTEHGYRHPGSRSDCHRRNRAENAGLQRDREIAATLVDTRVSEQRIQFPLQPGREVGGKVRGRLRNLEDEAEAGFQEFPVDAGREQRHRQLPLIELFRLARLEPKQAHHRLGVRIRQRRKHIRLMVL